MRRPTILYADGYDLVLFTVKQLLESESWSVDACRDGAAALKKITSDTQYDLLIVDERLPGVGGIELISRTRGTVHLHRVPIIMFTAEPCHGRALAAGASAFIKKPGGMGELIETCRSLLRQGHDLEAGVL